jgi:hypothetical protein
MRVLQQIRSKRESEGEGEELRDVYMSSTRTTL